MPGRSLPSPKRYAQAIFEIAQAADAFDEWQEQLSALGEACGEQGFIALLEAPGLTPEEKQRVVAEVLPDAEELAANLLLLLIERRAVSLAPQIAVRFRELVDAHRGIQRVQVASALPLSDDERQRITAELSRMFEGQVRLTEAVDPSLIGGLLVRVGDRVLDGSVRGRLAALKRSLAAGGS